MWWRRCISCRGFGIGSGTGIAQLPCDLDDSGLEGPPPSNQPPASSVCHRPVCVLAWRANAQPQGSVLPSLITLFVRRRLSVRCDSAPVNEHGGLYRRRIIAVCLLLVCLLLRVFFCQMLSMLTRVWLSALVAAALVPAAQLLDDSSSSGSRTAGSGDRPHSRQKRLIWITTDGRLALPPGTHLTITPTISLPFVRYPPDGFLSNMTISLPFTIDFDQLGLTDNQNPYGVLPPILARSMGRSMGVMLADYVASLLDKRRRRTSREEPAPQQPPPRGVFHGGERALLYAVVEDLLANFGMDGKACLLRAICEVHGQPLNRFGLIGEIVQLFFTASKSPFSELLDEYVAAERAGRDDGDCWRYYKDCPKSIFQVAHNKYKDEHMAHEEHDELSDNELASEHDNKFRDKRTSKVDLKPNNIGLNM
ncbi:hypothetical protein LSTR_LSTR000822 [Laodelphax striatellus]|uniref:Uncharacterized protein n=1 Tax=Laodelphax striatellus TaxID=195883 RepID=A0A482WI60_LAOST|nr:hypothetical protein LSTR_LSTR000822 [Laodelphax striatellus]